MNIKSLLLFLFITFAHNAFTQKQTSVGLNVNGEFLGSSYFRPGGGIVFEKRLSTSHGFETGLFYRDLKEESYLSDTFNGNFIHSNLAVFESYLSLPLSYKHYSNIVNFSIGLNFDYFIGWRYTSSNAEVKITSYEISPALQWGILAKCSKSFRLNEKFILEPEIRFTSIFIGETTTYYSGVGINGKFDLSSIMKSKQQIENL